MSDWASWRGDNQRAWDQRTALHLDSSFYDVPGFLAGKDILNAPERQLLSGVAGLDLLHLQCHFGLDTLAWAREGARVTGIDFSPRAIEEAGKLAVRAGFPEARFICRDIYEMETVVDAEAFDVAFTSYGTISWLPDLGRWAQLIYRALRPGGRLVFVDFHPFLYVYDFDSLQPTYPYFPIGEPVTETIRGTYAEPDAPVELVEHFWNHPVSALMTALLQAGLHLQEVQEWDYSPYPCFPRLVEVAPGRYQMPISTRPFPHLLGLVAVRPG